MATNIKLTLAYDGTQYKGWQKTRLGPSIEETLQNTLQQILQQPIQLQAASRTDAGVHAAGQVVNCFASSDKVDLNRLRLSLNQMLPRDIVILEIESMSEEFHPTLDVIGKEYRYVISHGPIQFPADRFYAWHFPSVLDLDQMHKSINYFIGEHDFGAFCNFKKNSKYQDYIRSISEIRLVELSRSRLEVRIIGKNFLYKMVRNIVGTMVYVGAGKIDVLEIPGILSSGDRTKAGVTAPAHGLTLWEVRY